MIPKTINVCGVPFSVEVVSDKFNTGQCGECDHMKCRIRISEFMTDELKMQSLIHEWIHAALVMVGRNDESSDEVLVQCLAMAIYQTFTLRSDEP